VVPSELEAVRLLPAIRAAGEAAEPLVCGVGLLAAGLATAERLGGQARTDSERVEQVLLLGLAGTRDPRAAPPGALVVGTAVRNEAFGAGHGPGFLGLTEMGLRSERLPPEVLPLAEPEGLTGADRAPALVRGVFGSVAAASGSPAEAQGWRERHPDVLAEDMETWAVALACARAGVPLSCVRAISNEAGDRNVATWHLEPAFAALLAVLPALLAAGPLPAPSPTPGAARR